jgi:uncharacterized damage-inducible protein DinB
MDREHTLARLAETRQALYRAIQDLGVEEMTQVQVEGVWTIKDILGHITSWEETCLGPLRRYAGGGPFQVDVIEDYLAWNDQQAARKRDITLDVILDELATVRQGLVDAARQLPPERWEQTVPFSWGGEGTIADVLDVFIQHELGHVCTIERWREGRVRGVESVKHDATRG